MGMYRRTALLGLVLAITAGLLLSGCGTKTTPADTSAEQAKPVAIKIGTLATADSLPLWVAEDKGYFEAEGLPKVEIVVFQSAQEREAAFASGAIDAFMGDIMVAANLDAAGSDVVLPMVMLGAEPSQGRFAIVAAPKSKIQTLSDLKGVPVATSSSTIVEYVLDKLMEQGGIDAADVKKEELKKVPVRFQLLMAGKVKAAMLPEPFVTLAQQGGAIIPEGGDDTGSPVSLSQTIFGISGDYIATPEGAATLDALLKAWDKAVADINADPSSFRQTLVEKAMLPAPLADTFKVDTYPTAAAPTPETIQPVLDWMKAKGYLTADVTPEDLLAE